jgi:hypothetical protein
MSSSLNSLLRLCHFNFNGRGVKLTTQLRLEHRLRMRGAIPPPPIRVHGVVLN